MPSRLLCLLLLFATSGVLCAQDGIIGQGFSTGFNNPGDITAFSPSAGGSQIYITNSTATGPQFFRLANGTSELGPVPCTGDADRTGTEGFSYDNMTTGCGFAFSIDVDDLNDTYIFKTPGATENDFIFFRFEGDVPAFEPALTSRLPTGNPVNSNATVSFSAGTDAVVPVGGALYMRYTLDGFATSTVVKMDGAGGGGQIFFYDLPPPPNNEGQTLTYYFFLSGDDTNVEPQSNGSDADYRTIALENNGGSNYSFMYSSTAPVTYRSFSGRRTTAGVALEWATATEVNAAYFSLECSEDDGRSWNERSRVTARNQATGANYAFLDRTAPDGDLQYRLRQVDFDGTFAYSDLLRISGATDRPALAVFPQPARDELNVRIPNAGNLSTEGRLDIRDLTGRLLFSQRVTGDRPTLPLTGFQAGVYLLQYRQADRLLHSQRFVKF